MTTQINDITVGDMIKIRTKLPEIIEKIEKETTLLETKLKSKNSTNKKTIQDKYDAITNILQNPKAYIDIFTSSTHFTCREEIFDVDKIISDLEIQKQNIKKELDDFEAKLKEEIWLSTKKYEVSKFTADNMSHVARGIMNFIVTGKTDTNLKMLFRTGEVDLTDIYAKYQYPYDYRFYQEIENKKREFKQNRFNDFSLVINKIIEELVNINKIFANLTYKIVKTHESDDHITLIVKFFFKS